MFCRFVSGYLLFTCAGNSIGSRRRDGWQTNSVRPGTARGGWGEACVADAEKGTVPGNAAGRLHQPESYYSQPRHSVWSERFYNLQQALTKMLQCTQFDQAALIPFTVEEA